MPYKGWYRGLGWGFREARPPYPFNAPLTFKYAKYVFLDAEGVPFYVGHFFAGFHVVKHRQLNTDESFQLIKHYDLSGSDFR